MRDVAKVIGLGPKDDGGAAAIQAQQAQQAQAAQTAIINKQEQAAADERAKLLSEQMARQRAARRGGFRGLLSDQRLNPETGLSTTLGA